VNCGAIPETLMESEFFGYRKGAFTGADSERDGFFQAAAGAPCFSTRSSNCRSPCRSSCCAPSRKSACAGRRVAEEPVDVRLISASHQDLQAAVSQGRFRQDLFYRLNVIEIHMPALRERREDVAELAGFLLVRLCEGRATPHWRHPPRRRWPITTIPATCANWKTFWSGRWRCATAARSAATTSI